jgi:hypothetical protein
MNTTEIYDSLEKESKIWCTEQCQAGEDKCDLTIVAERKKKRKESTRKYWVSNNIECIVGVFSRRNEPKPVEDSGLSCM